MLDFKDQVVLITGAGRGAGRAVAQAFARSGALVAANDITPINLDETVAAITRAGGKVRDYVFDVAKRIPVETLINQVLDDWGRIDILVSCAGVSPHAPLLDLDDWDWQRSLDVNLSGPFFVMQLAGRAMRIQGGGAIVSLGGTPQDDCLPAGQTAYRASKAGLVGLTLQAACELAPYGIRVNLVCPPDAPPGGWAAAGRRAPSPQEIASAVLPLCSPASNLSGQIIHLQSQAGTPS